GVTLTAENHKQLWVPPGCAHGFYALSDSADFLYKCTDYYHPGSEITLAWDDPTVGINWPILNGTLPQVSEKDCHGIHWDALPLFSSEALRQP
ncbi:dTDP-4-dehydrorhamnose 3,5-epimerase, partial [Luminiphilus sp.]